MRSKQTKLLYSVLLGVAACVLVLTAWTTYAWLAADHDVVYIDNLSGKAHAAYFNGGDGSAPAVDGATYKAADATYPSYLNETAAHPSVGPYQIDNPIQLYNLAWLQYLGYFNSDNGSGAVNQTYFVLTADIDLTTGDFAGLTLPPIGTAEFPFLGNFDGQGHTIRGLHVSNLKSELDNGTLGTTSVVVVPTDAQENGVLNDPAEIVGFFGLVGETDDGTPGSYTYEDKTGVSHTVSYDSSAVAVKNVVIENAAIKTQTTNSLAGVAVGYVNGTLENVKLIGGSIQSSATTAVSGIGTANLSDYGAVGYCTADYRSARDEVSVLVYDPQVLTATGSGAQSGIGNAWGGSVDMKSMYQDLLTRYQASTTAERTYADSYTITHNADGRVSEMTAGQGTNTAALTTERGNSILEKKETENGDEIASYTFVRRDDTNKYLYLYGRHATEVEADVTHLFSENEYYIHADGNYLCFNGSAFSNTAVADGAAIPDSVTRWVITDDGLIYRVTRSGDSYNREYLIRTAENTLYFLGPFDVTAAVPAVTPWVVTDSAIHIESYFLCYKDGVWKLDQLVQTNVLCDSAEEHYMSVSSGTIGVALSKSGAATWTETPTGTGGGFTLSTDDSGTTRYLMVNITSGALYMAEDPDDPTVWYRREATATETPKIYTLTDGTEGYAIAYDVSTDSWTAAAYSSASSGTGVGDSFGDSIPMKSIYDRLSTAWNTAYGTNAQGNLTRNNPILYPTAETVYIRNGVAEAPKPTSYGQRTGPYITTQQFYSGLTVPYASYSFALYLNSNTTNKQYLYLYGEDTIPYGTKSVTTITIDTVDAFYISDGDGHYLAATASGVSTADSEAAATKWRIENGRISTQFTVDQTETHYLRNVNGALEVGTAEDASWTVGDGTITNGAYSLCCFNGSWMLLQATEYLQITSGEHVFTLTVEGTDCDQWFLTNDGYLYTLPDASGTPYYLTVNGGAPGYSSNAGSAAQWTITDDSVSTGGLYLAYSDGAWVLTPGAETYLFHSAGGSYLAMQSNGSFVTADETGGTKWLVSGELSAATVSTVLNGTTYYLYNNNGAPGVTTTAGSAAVWNIGADAMTTDGLTLLPYNGGWRLADPAARTISSGSHYLSYSGSGTSVSDAGSAAAAADWIFSAETGDGVTIHTVVNGTTYYLRRNNNTLYVDTNTANNTWTVEADGKIHSGDYYLVYDGGWKLSQKQTYYLIHSGGTYLNANSEETNVVPGSDAATATRWQTVPANNGSGTVRTASGKYLYASGGGWFSTPSLSLNASSSTSWSRSNNLSYSTGGWFSTTYYLRYSGSWSLDTNSATLSFDPVEEAIGWNISNEAKYTDTSVSATSHTAVIETSHETAEIDLTANTTAATLDWTSGRTTANNQSSSYHTNPTYLPLSFENGAIPRANTGYIISGSNLGTPGTEAYGYNGKGDIRVSYYNKTGGNYNISGSLTNGKLMESKMYTIYDGETMTLEDYGIENFEKYSDALVNGETVRGSKYKMQNTLDTDTQSRIYGLHFMNAEISTARTVTVQNAYINGKTYPSLVMPQDCIDFRLKERGYINFFAGTYFSGNDSFFSLHRIEHNADGTIQSIKEILEIYKNGSGDPYVYKLQEGSTVTYESWEYWPNGNVKNHKTYDGVPDGYTLAFNTAWIKQQTSVNTNSVYYFEIPVDPGEYALGSVSGGTGAYLMYLDIGAAGTKDQLIGDSMLVFESTPGLDVSHTYTGSVSSYEVSGEQYGVKLYSDPTYYPLTWENGAVSAENTGYVVAGAYYTEANPEGDIRVAYYNKNDQSDTSYSIWRSLNSAGTLNNSRVYTILPNGTETSINEYGIGSQFTLQYRGVSAEMNDLLDGEDNVYGLHFMPSEISTNHLITADKVTLVTLPDDHTAENYPLPEDCIDFVVEDQGRITFFAGTFFSGSRVYSFFSLHRIFRDAQNNITAIRELSEIWSKNGSASSEQEPYIYRYKNTAGYFDKDGNPVADASDYSKLYDLSVLSSSSDALRQDTVYYFEIPIDPGEYALGSAEGNGAYLLYLDIAANAEHIESQTVIDVMQTKVVSLNYPEGVAFVSSASDAVNPAASVYLALPMASSGGTTSFSMSGDALTVTNATSTLAGYTGSMSIGEGKTLKVNSDRTYYATGSLTRTETVRTVDMNPNGETKTTEYRTTLACTDAYGYNGTTTATKTVSREMGGTAIGNPETTTLTYDADARRWYPPYDYPLYDGSTLDSMGSAAIILRVNYTDNYKSATPSNTVERVGRINAVPVTDAEEQIKEITLSFYGDEDTYEICNAVRDNANDVPAGVYMVTGPRAFNVPATPDSSFQYLYRRTASADGQEFTTAGSYYP